jgi:penicillin-binding protein 2
MNIRVAPGTLPSKNVYRFGSFAIVAVVAVTALSGQMAFLQLAQGAQAAPVQTGAAAETTPLPATRGLIYDDKHEALVKNTPDFTIEVIPHDLPLDQKATEVQRLATLLNMDPLVIDQEIDSWTGSMYDPVVIADRVPTDVARVIDENTGQLPGVHVVARELRQYTYGSLFGPILGYTGHPTNITQALREAGYTEDDIIGLGGLEQWYEPELRGTYGQATVAVDNEGRPIAGLSTTVVPPIAGSSLTLTLDRREQTLASRALTWGLGNSHVKMGAIVVMNPQNGEILAMVSYPGYDDNIFSQGISQATYQAMLNDPTAPLVNKAVQDQFAPGSTYKLVTGTAALQDGIITDQTKIMSMPYYAVPQETGGTKPYWEWNQTGWGPLTIYGGLAHSSDTFFYQLADRVGLNSLTYWAEQYGFGSKTGVDLPGEASGVVPDNQWKQENLGQPMYRGEVLQAGIGQGYDAVTPLQLLNAYCALANGGNLWQPHLVKSITDPDGNVTVVPPTLIRKLPVSAQTLQIMRKGTRAVVTSRHTYNLVDLPIVVAGKTGTAEFGNPDRYGRLPYHEWFVAYTPADAYHGSVSGTDSQLAVVVFSYGANTWGDISTEIAKYYLMLHYGIRGYNNPTSSALPYAVNLWAFKTTNFYGSANNH